MDTFVELMGHNWQKWKSTSLTCHCHKIYRVETVGLKKSNNTFQITIFVSLWNFGAISWKFDILSMTAWLKFESKNPFAQMWPIWLWLATVHHIWFLLNKFSVKYRLPFPILHFLPWNHVALLKDRFLKKILKKKPSAFFHKTIGSNNSFTPNENNFTFLR